MSILDGLSLGLAAGLFIYLLVALLLHQQRQVLQQLRGMKVLFHRCHAAAAEVVQTEGLLETAVIRFDAPAAVIDIREHLSREGLPIQQGGQQHLTITAGQFDPNQAQFDLSHRIDAGFGAKQARLGVAGSEELCVLRLSRLEKLFDLRVVATRKAHQEMPLLLLKQCEQPVPRVPSAKQCQAVGGHMIKMQVGTITLAELGCHYQAVQGLAVGDIVEHGKTGNG